MSVVLGLAPPGRVELVPERGEMFLRDTGPETARKGTVLLLHGWMFPSDLNWITCYGPLRDSGYRVIAVDHRGHGRGIRTMKPFRLTDCADDAAGLIRKLGIEQVVVVGYSMGGAIAQLFAQRHPDLTEGAVLCATSLQWSDRRSSRLWWRTMGVLQLWMNNRSRRFWLRLLRRQGLPADGEMTDWIVGELERGSAVDIAEAGREMARFNSRPWIGQVPAPINVVLTTQDQLIPPKHQRDIAAHIPGARVFEVRGDHVAVSANADRFIPALLEAITDVQARAQGSIAEAATA
jgi:3-oxoadipate enol-lactonase